MVQSRFTAIGIGYPNPWSSLLGEMASRLLGTFVSRQGKTGRHASLTRLGDKTLEDIGADLAHMPRIRRKISWTI